MPTLRFASVTSTYASRKAIDSLSFVVEAGERVALVGPSGAGKTTIFRLAYGAMTPTRGRVEIHGVDIATVRGRSLRETRAHIAVIFQAHGLIDRLSVSQNVIAGTFGRRDTVDSLRAVVWPSEAERALAAEALARVGLADRARDRAFDLSGGERQRVAIARAIAQRADLILADEPAASLDPERGRNVVDMMLADARERGASLLCSLHQPNLARLFDRIVRIENGRLVP